MFKLTDLPEDITPRQIQELAVSQYQLLLQNDGEWRLLQQRHFDETLDESRDSETFESDSLRYLARKKELDENRQGYLDLLEQLKDLYESKTSRS